MLVWRCGRRYGARLGVDGYHRAVCCLTPETPPRARVAPDLKLMIVVDDLVKRFGRTLAVDRVSFEVGRGEIVGFLGPNGAGKTTTIRVLTCFHPPTAGRASIAGHDCFDSPIAVRRHIGYLPQDVPIYPDMRVHEYLRYRAALKGVPRRQRRSVVDGVIERCNIEEVRNKLVDHVSHGFRQRVGFADALVANPPVLILDEPTSGLDPNQRVRIKQLVRDLANDHTILFSSHILAEVAEVADRVVVIHRGAKKADGAVDELLHDAPGRELVVTASGSPDDVLALGTGLDGVGDGRVLARSEDSMVTIAWPLEPDVDPRDAVFDRAAQGGRRLRELRLEHPTLESYFHTVTEGEAGLDDGVATFVERDTAPREVSTSPEEDPS